MFFQRFRKPNLSRQPESPPATAPPPHRRSTEQAQPCAHPCVAATSLAQKTTRVMRDPKPTPPPPLPLRYRLATPPSVRAPRQRHARPTSSGKLTASPPATASAPNSPTLPPCEYQPETPPMCSGLRVPRKRRRPSPPTTFVTPGSPPPAKRPAAAPPTPSLSDFQAAQPPDDWLVPNDASFARPSSSDEWWACAPTSAWVWDELFTPFEVAPPLDNGATAHPTTAPPTPPPSPPPPTTPPPSTPARSARPDERGPPPRPSKLPSSWQRFARIAAQPRTALRSTVHFAPDTRFGKSRRLNEDRVKAPLYDELWYHEDAYAHAQWCYDRNIA